MKLRETVRKLLGRGEEQRAITGVPWDVGGPLRPSSVSAEQALGLVPVFAAVRLLASQIASLPLQGYRKVGPPGGEIRTRIATPSLFTQPSVHGTLYDWLHRAVTSLALRGNAYGLIVTRNADQYPTTIEWLHPDDVWCNDLAPAGPGSYANPTWFWKGREISAENLLHIAWFTTPGRIQGLSPIGACAATLTTGLSAQDYTARWFDNGAVPPGKFRNVEKKINQVEASEIGARLNMAIRTRKPLVYGNDWEYDPIAVAAHEAKFIETAKLTATQIAAIYGIPPEMIGGDTGSSLTYSTVEQNALNFVKFTLRPWLELLEEAFFPLVPRPQYVRFNVDALLRTDLQTRMASYQTARNIGLNCIDELRALEEQPPLPAGKGKDYTPLVILQRGSTDTATARTGRPAGADWLDGDWLDRATAPRNGNGRPPGTSGRPMSGAAAMVALEARRDDPAHPAAMLDGKRKFNPAEPRDPFTGEWIDTTPGDGNALGIADIPGLSNIVASGFIGGDRGVGYSLDMSDGDANFAISVGPRERVKKHVAPHPSMPGQDEDLATLGEEEAAKLRRKLTAAANAVDAGKPYGPSRVRGADLGDVQVMAEDGKVRFSVLPYGVEEPYGEPFDPDPLTEVFDDDLDRDRPPTAAEIADYLADQKADYEADVAAYNAALAARRERLTVALTGDEARRLAIALNVSGDPQAPAGRSRPALGAAAMVALEARRDDPAHPAAMLDGKRKFNPAEPRDPHTGEWIDGVPGSQAAQDLVDKTFRTISGREANAWGREHFTPIADLPDVQKTAIKRYGGGASYNVNKLLRGQAVGPSNRREAEIVVSGVDAVMAGHRVPENVVVTRALGVDAFGGDPTTWVGKTFTDRGYMSTTLGDKVTGKQSTQRVHMTIEVPAGTHGYWMKGASQFTEERELLLDRGLTLDITEVVYNKRTGRWTVRARARTKRS